MCMNLICYKSDFYNGHQEAELQPKKHINILGLKGKRHAYWKNTYVSWSWPFIDWCIDYFCRETSGRYQFLKGKFFFPFSDYDIHYCKYYIIFIVLFIF